MTPPRSFADRPRTNGRPRNTCPRCGGPTAVLIGIDVRILDDQRRPSARLRSLSKNLCEPCGVEAYEMLEEAFGLAVTT
jgi:hypothetical protein